MNHRFNIVRLPADFFKDDRIMLLAAQPNGNDLLVVWFRLLCLGCTQREPGVFQVNEALPYTDEMLASVFTMPVETVSAALDEFEKLGLITRPNGVVTIPNGQKIWYTTDALEKRREADRNRMREIRAQRVDNGPRCE